ncbi:MAG: AarF/ABC1/UbiB kinase family protein [bacterium]|nr:AarF/ABC1/UbiB kinase family protein [bacterium]
MSRDRPSTSAFRRFVKLGGLAGRVGASLLSEQVLELARSEDSKEERKTETLVRNAIRVVETLGELKGAAMKVGQMLSLQVGLLPPEVAAVLRALQKNAPRVPFEVMQYEIKGQIEDYDRLFAHLEPQAFAAASIGQVHRAELRDGRRVAVKIQYPAIDYIIRADMKNLRVMLQALFSLFSTADFDPIWKEVRDRLLEEIDYRQEAENLKRMAELHVDVPEIVIPKVVEEASAHGVLTMEYLEGISPERACSDEFPQKLKNQWGRVLFELQFRGIFEHRLLHADPNLANFAFLDDGRVIVYDFGCVKRPPDKLVRGYAAIIRAALDGRRDEIPELLVDLGVFKEGGVPLPAEVVDPYLDIFSEILRPEPPYMFGEDEELYQKLIDLGMDNLSAARDLQFPEDIVFIDRCLAGHFGNMTKLGATGVWRGLVAKYVEAV